MNKEKRNMNQVAVSTLSGVIEARAQVLPLLFTQLKVV